MKLLNKLRKILNDDRIFYRIAFCGIMIGMIVMFLTIWEFLTDIIEDTRVSIIQQETMVCTPQYDNRGTLYFECSVPSYQEVKDYLEQS